MKIVIIGAGIAGLTSYLFILKHLSHVLPPSDALDIHIYDSHDAPRRSKGTKEAYSNTIVGAALGVAPNGLSVLRSLDETLLQRVMRQGYPVKAFRFQAARGWHLGDWPCTGLSEPFLPTLMISRQGLWEEIRETVPDESFMKRKVKSVKWDDEGKPIVRFTDGGEENADLVLGADGVKSVVRDAVLGSDDPKKYDAVHEGFCGIGALIPTSCLGDKPPRGQTAMTFGPNGFFGYGPCSSSSCLGAGPTSVFWSTFEVRDPPSDVNPGPSAEEIVSGLRDRHQKWEDPTIKSILKTVTPATLGTLWPTSTIPQLPSWYKRGVVLVGDAAHALQPTSGQGASQALEDCETIALALEHTLKQLDIRDDDQVKKEIDKALQIYQEVRMPKVAAIKKRSEQMGSSKKDMGWVMEMFMYAAMGIMSAILRWRPGALGMRETYEDIGGREVLSRYCQTNDGPKTSN